MLETSARLLRLLSLLQSRRFWSGAELAGELDVTERTVRRDVDKLRALGYPVHATSGVAGGYRLGAGARLPPLLLDDDEALAVSLGLRSAASGAVAGMEESALRALAKLGQVLPARLRHRMASFNDALVAMPFRGPRVDPEVLSALGNACHERARLRFDYQDKNARDSHRDVDPHGLVHTHARWYLVAWDHDRDDWRTFRVDRVRSPVVASELFVPRELPFGDLASYVSNTLERSALPHRARIELHAPLCAVQGCLPASVGSLTPLAADRCLLETGAEDLCSLALYVGLLGVDFSVLDPPELTEHLDRLQRRLARAVGSSRAT